MSSKVPKSIGAKVRLARREAQLSQKELGVKILLSDKAISSYEVNRAVPSLQILQKIGRAVGKPVSYFLDDVSSAQIDLAAKLDTIEQELAAIRKYLAEQKQ